MVEAGEALDGRIGAEDGLGGLLAAAVAVFPTGMVRPSQHGEASGLGDAALDLHLGARKGVVLTLETGPAGAQDFWAL